MPISKEQNTINDEHLDAVDSYFECITSCSIGDEGSDCVTQCLEVHLKPSFD